MTTVIHTGPNKMQQIAQALGSFGSGYAQQQNINRQRQDQLNQQDAENQSYQARTQSMQAKHISDSIDEMMKYPANHPARMLKLFQLQSTGFDMDPQYKKQLLEAPQWIPPDQQAKIENANQKAVQQTKKDNSDVAREYNKANRANATNMLEQLVTQYPNRGDNEPEPAPGSMLLRTSIGNLEVPTEIGGKYVKAVDNEGFWNQIWAGLQSTTNKAKYGNFQDFIDSGISPEDIPNWRDLNADALVKEAGRVIKGKELKKDYQDKGSPTDPWAYEPSPGDTKPSKKVAKSKDGLYHFSSESAAREFAKKNPGISKAKIWIDD
jgi:hypothetical protein